MIKAKQLRRSEIYYPAYRNWNEEMQKRADIDAMPVGDQINLWLESNQDIKIIALALSGEGKNETAIIIYDQTGNTSGANQ